MLRSIAVQGEALAADGQRQQREPKSTAPYHTHEVASNRGEALVAQSRSVF
jgi:hypothetical protein